MGVRHASEPVQVVPAFRKWPTMRGDVRVNRYVLRTLELDGTVEGAEGQGRLSIYGHALL